MMVSLKESKSHLSPHAQQNHRFADRSSKKICAVMLIVSLGLLWLQIATAQQDSGSLQQRKAALEVQKLELEVAKLKDEHIKRLPWLPGHPGLFGFLGGLVTATASFLLARRARLGALDQSVHDKRLELYPQLVKASARLAIYFPNRDLPDPSRDLPAAWIGQEDCRAMGQAMSRWYFEGGGLLLSVKARDAYFRLARALTRASLAKDLRVPVFPKDSEDISVEKINKYQAELSRKYNLDDVENWNFGEPESEKEKPAFRFKDYVFLRQLSSTLRTTLSKDLRSRRRPS